MNHLTFALQKYFNSPFTAIGGNTSSWVLLPKIMDGAIGIAGVIMLFLLLGAGWQIISSQGNNPEGMKKAAKTATSAIVGMMVVVFAYLIVQLLETYFFNNSHPLTAPDV